MVQKVIFLLVFFLLLLFVEVLYIVIRWSCMDPSWCWIGCDGKFRKSLVSKVSLVYILLCNEDIHLLYTRVYAICPLYHPADQSYLPFETTTTTILVILNTHNVYSEILRYVSVLSYGA